MQYFVNKNKMPRETLWMLIFQMGAEISAWSSASTQLTWSNPTTWFHLFLHWFGVRNWFHLRNMTTDFTDTNKGINITLNFLDDIRFQVTCFIVFLIKLTVVLSDSSSMSSLGGSGSFGPINGSLLVVTPVSECSSASFILRFLFSRCVVRGTNLTEDWFEVSLCAVPLSLSEEVWLELELSAGCCFVLMMASCNVPILSSVCIVPCWFLCLW